MKEATQYWEEAFGATILNEEAIVLEGELKECQDGITTIAEELQLELRKKYPRNDYTEQLQYQLHQLEGYELELIATLKAMTG